MTEYSDCIQILEPTLFKVGYQTLSPQGGGSAAPVDRDEGEKSLKIVFVTTTPGSLPRARSYRVGLCPTPPPREFKSGLSSAQAGVTGYILRFFVHVSLLRKPRNGFKNGRLRKGAEPSKTKCPTM